MLLRGRVRMSARSSGSPRVMMAVSRHIARSHSNNPASAEDQSMEAACELVHCSYRGHTPHNSYRQIAASSVMDARLLEHLQQSEGPRGPRQAGTGPPSSITRLCQRLNAINSRISDLGHQNYAGRTASVANRFF